MPCGDLIFNDVMTQCPTGRLRGAAGVDGGHLRRPQLGRPACKRQEVHQVRPDALHPQALVQDTFGARSLDGLTLNSKEYM